MAKSARASGVKKNNQALKKKVFGPVESARNERLSAKLLELAQQPRTPNSEMDIEPTGKLEATCAERRMISDNHTLAGPQDASMETKEDNMATEGASASSLSIPIPASLLHNNPLSTPPLTPDHVSANTTTPILDIPAQKKLAKELLFYHMLGASTDIVGFDENGDLQLSFAAT
jgi:hypothetical protein